MSGDAAGASIDRSADSEREVSCWWCEPGPCSRPRLTDGRTYVRTDGRTRVTVVWLCGGAACAATAATAHVRTVRTYAHE
jgi:hypothetical protein